MANLDKMRDLDAIDEELMLSTYQDQLAKLAKFYGNLRSELRKIENDFGFEYKVGDIRKWISIGERYDKTKKEIIKLLSEFLEFLEENSASTGDKVIALSNLIRPFRFQLFFGSSEEKIIAKIIGCNPMYVKRILDRYSKRKINSTLRYKVLKRDSFSCAICNSKTNLEVHHIIPPNRFVFPKKADRLENLITLCKKCHYTIHGGHFEQDCLPYKNKEEFYQIIRNPFWVRLWLAVCKFFPRERDKIFKELSNRFKNEESFREVKIEKLAKYLYTTNSIVEKLKNELIK